MLKKIISSIVIIISMGVCYTLKNNELLEVCLLGVNPIIFLTQGVYISRNTKNGLISLILSMTTYIMLAYFLKLEFMRYLNFYIVILVIAFICKKDVINN